MELIDVKGVGKKTLEHLKNEGIFTIDDLIYTFPKSYSIYEINNSDLYSGNSVTVEGFVDASPVFLKYRGNVNTIIFYVFINGLKVKCVCFSSDYLRYKLFKGVSVILHGKYKKENREFLVSSIFFDKFSIRIDVDYKLKNVSNSMMSKAVKSALGFVNLGQDNLPKELIDRYKLLSLKDTVFLSHFPQTKNDYIQIQRRRKYDEFFWYSVSLELLNYTRKDSNKSKRNVNYPLIQSFMKSLPYELTDDQRKTIDTVYNDINKEYPMNRLVQGDVGSGKSIVSFIAALMLVTSGYQAAIMVPTELLANQQYENIKNLLKPFNLSIELLTSSVKNKDKADILYRLINNRVNIVIGTHALLEENVLFYKLGIIIIDEQHRFGVKQRSKLISKYQGVDCLYLTATPIPRTLGLTTFGDLDISSIYTMPKNRKAVKTKIYNYNDIDNIANFIRRRAMNKEQTYIVAPLVDEGMIDAIDVKKAFKLFSEKLPDLKIGVVHGKLSSDTKNKIMLDFKNKRYDVLISTTVIEVGVDVKDATTMIILDASRYGLAQIHQLRGRVGRSDKESYCFLVSNIKTDRLSILENINNGFDIAVEDFKLRGPGDYLGNEQSGHMSLNYADFQNDFKIWCYAKEDGIEYCHKFLNEKTKNKKFLGILEIIKSKKGKIN